MHPQDDKNERNNAIHRYKYKHENVRGSIRTLGKMYVADYLCRAVIFLSCLC